jgi:hypothetical protein
MYFMHVKKKRSVSYMCERTTMYLISYLRVTFWGESALRWLWVYFIDKFRNFLHGYFCRSWGEYKQRRWITFDERWSRIGKRLPGRVGRLAWVSLHLKRSLIIFPFIGFVFLMVVISNGKNIHNVRKRPMKFWQHTRTNSHTFQSFR